MTLTFDVVYPQHRARHNGIADYSVDMARSLVSLGHKVRLLSAGGSQPFKDIEDVDAWPSAGDRGASLSDLSVLTPLVLDCAPDVLVVQFEQFSYGTRGWNPRFARLFGALRRKGFKGKCVLVVHETYTPPDSFGHTMMSIYQRHQVAALVKSADVVIHSSARGIRQLGHLNSRSMVLPVPSNIPVQSCDRVLKRTEIGLRRRSVGILLFGALGDLVFLQALRRSIRDLEDCVVVYVGKGSAMFDAFFHDTRRVNLGELSEGEVSQVMQACDLGVVVPKDGISARRGSYAAMALHGLPVVSCVGPDTDQYLLDAAQAGALYLASDPADLCDAVLRLAADPATRLSMRAAINTAGLRRTPLVNAQELLEFIGQA